MRAAGGTGGSVCRQHAGTRADERRPHLFGARLPVRIHRRDGLAASVPSPAQWFESTPYSASPSTGDFGRRGPRGVGHRRAVGASAERWRVCHAHQPPAPIYPAAAIACRCAVPRAMAMRLVTLVQMGGTCLCAGPHRLRGVSTGAPSSARRCSLTVVAPCLLHVAFCLGLGMSGSLQQRAALRCAALR